MEVSAVSLLSKDLAAQGAYTTVQNHNNNVASGSTCYVRLEKNTYRYKN